MEKFGFSMGAIAGIVLTIISMVSWYEGIPITFNNPIWTNIIQITLGLMFLPGVLGAAFCVAMLTEDGGPGKDFGNN